MKVKCDFCGNYIDDADEKCSYCGAANTGIKRSGTGVPKTIEELKQWYIDHNLPDENTTRFFIGKDYSGPRAYGIFKKDSGDFVVYKNKSDGTRATRYIGTDEEYAVNEIYLKLKEEITNQKARSTSQRSTYNPSSNNYNSAYRNYANTNRSAASSDKSAFLIIIILIFLIVIIISSSNSKHSGGGYYNSGYNYGSSYYDYDNDDYYSSSSSSSSWDSWSSSDWDSSSSWDSYDSWDSDWSDWDSDW